MATSDVDSDDKNESILYDLTVHAEWKQDNEIFKKAVGRDSNVSLVGRLASTTQRTGWTILRSLGLPLQTASPCYLPPSLVKLNNSALNWQIAVGNDGHRVAVLQDSCIEIRSNRDEFSSVSGKVTIQRDTHPQWRHLVWNSDSTMLACSYSNGTVEVYDIVGTQLFTIPGRDASQNSMQVRDLSDAVASLIFEDLKAADDEGWTSELTVINHHGTLTCYRVDRDKGYKLHYNVYFNQYYPLGVSCVESHVEVGLLYVGGCGQEDEGMSAAGVEGLTAWRKLSDYPHYKLVTDYAEDLNRSQSQRSLRKRFKLPSLSYLKGSHPSQDGVFKLSLSPLGKYLACIHFSGKLSIWSVPGLQLQQSWTHEQQSFCDEISPEFTENPLLRKQIKDLVNTKNLLDVSWWSNEAVILARGTGAVTVSSITKLNNLLGTQPEWFEPAPKVTSVHNGGFLGLEVECRFPKRRLVSVSDDEEEEESDDEDAGLISRSWGVAKQGIHYVTDMDTFKPPKKKPRLVNRTYRLVCLMSTTPEELFKRKLEDEEYGEAKSLAQAYGLDVDLVYQKQWRNSPVEIASIQDYLSKISKRSWVLHECMERMSDQIDAMKELLEFGMRGTDLPVLSLIGRGEDKGRFILCDPDDGLYEDLELNEFDPDMEEKKQQLRDERRDTLMAEINFDNLNLEQRELCRARKKLLQYLYRLKTYESILGGRNYAAERFDPKFFEKFRSQNIVTTALDYAQTSDWKALEILFTFHGKELLPHRAAILSNFPETTDPTDYKSLLPAVSGSDVGEWEEDCWDTIDWVEMDPCRTALEPVYHDPGEYLYEEQPHMAKYRGQLTPTILSDWYQDRAVEIERLSRLADFALEFVKLGIERSVEGLETILDELVTMDMLVYSCHVDDNFLFKQLQEMTDYDRLELIMSKSPDMMYSKNLRKWMVPFLKQCERRAPGSYCRLLRDYLVTLAREDLAKPLLIFEASKTHLPNPVIMKQAELMSLAIDAIYSCERDDQLQLAMEVLKCLPQRGYGVDTKEVQKLHLVVDKLEHHLNAAKILEENGIKKPLYFIRDTEAVGDEAEQLIIKLTRMAARRPVQMSEAQWSKLHVDIMEMQDKVYRCISTALCHEIFVESLLSSGNTNYIKLAGRMLERSEEESHKPTPQVYHMHTKVVYDRSIELVLQAAKEYFDSSANLNDECMALARSCLNLIQDNPVSIQEENDLISSLTLLEDFQLSVLPLQVRLSSDRLDLVKKCIEQKTTAYKNTQKLLRLGHLLRVSAADRTERDGKVNHLIAQAAIKADDFLFAYEMCEQLIESGHGSAWDVCVDLAECETFTNIPAKVELLSFAVTFCSPEMIEPILQARALLETQVLYEGINTEVEENAEKTNTRISPFSTTAALDQTRQILTSTKQTTRAVLSTVTDKKWWHGTVKKLKQPASRQLSLDYSNRNVNMERQACHPFYEDVCPNCYLNIGECDLCGINGGVSETVLVNEKLLRTAQLEEMLTEGEKSHSATEVLIQLAKESFTTDSALSLAYLLALKQPVEANQCFSEYPNTDISLQLALYYYTLQLYAAMKPVELAKMSPLYLHKPVYVMRKVRKLVTQKKEVAWPDYVSDLVKQISVYNEMLRDYRQAKVLKQLGRGIDLHRFTSDKEYKEETILGLAMSMEENIYQIAVSLAERYEIPVWMVYAAHLEFLFCDSGLSVEEIEARVTKMNILPALRSEPQAFCDRMKTYVYPSLTGTDQPVLIYYYMTMEGCGITLEAGLTAAAHVKILKKLKTVVPDLDYKALMDEKVDVMSVLSSHLNSANIVTVAKLAKQIPDRKGGCLEASFIYCTWAVKFFWEGDGKKQPDTTIAWMHRLEACGEFINKLAPTDILSFLHNVVFTEQSRDKLETNGRIEICKRILKVCRQHTSKKKKPEAESEVSWESVVSSINGYMKHLATLNHDSVQELAQSEDSRVQQYLTLYDQSMGDTDKIYQLLVQMALEGEMTIEDLNQFITDNTQSRLSLVIQDAIQHIVDNLCQKPRKKDITIKPLPALENIVQKVQDHIENDGELVQAEKVLSQLRPFCSDSSVDVQPRLDVLHILEKSFKLSEEDCVLLTLYRTQAVIATIWSQDKILEESISQSEQRKKLFYKYLEKVKVMDEGGGQTDGLQALCKLLELWPSFSQAPCDPDSPWTFLLQVMINSGCHANMQLALTTVKSAKGLTLSLQSIEVLFQSYLEQKAQLEAVTMAMIVGYPEMFEAVLSTLKNMTQISDDKELIELLLRHNFVTQLVSTPHYPVIIRYVLANQDPGLGSHDYRSIQKIANDLEEAGFLAEAGYLLAQARATHPLLQTFGSALGSFLTRFK